MSNRDDFNKSIIDTLAKRVGYICSNPDCNAHTIGPNHESTKHSNVGVASHITAASPRGPRFNEKISSATRKGIDNAIWLCNNCARLIDSDPQNFSTELLQEWKINAENRQRDSIAKPAAKMPSNEAYIDVDIVWKGGGRFIEGYSTKNPQRIENDITYYDISGTPIAFYRLEWRYNVIIYNNSEVPVYNIFTEYLSDVRFMELSILPSINNLAPLANITLDARFHYLLEDTFKNADKILHEKIPSLLNNLRLKIGYLDNRRVGRNKVICINNGLITYE